MAKKYLSLEGLVEYDSLLKTNLDIALGNYQDALNQISSGTTVVGKAQEATHAESATTANSATEATHAVSADTATRAVNADNADNAAHAVTADSATTAGSATKATQDGNGKVISETYETKADASAKLVEAKEYTDEQIAAIPSSVGKNVTGQEFVINEETVVAENGAEVFNDYEYNIATGWCSHAEGAETTASGEESHAEGYLTIASGMCSHAEGRNAKAEGTYSHAEGHLTTATGEDSHAEGYYTIASGQYSHAEGRSAKAEGTQSHAEGYYTTATGESSHAEGNQTTASGDYQHVQGKFNVADNSGEYADIVGNGTSNTKRSNAHTLDWNGNAWFAGDVYVGSTGGKNKDNGSKKLVTEAELNTKTGVTVKTWTSADV